MCGLNLALQDEWESSSLLSLGQPRVPVTFASGRNSQKNNKRLQMDPRLASLAGPHSVVSIEQIVFDKISKGGKVDLWIWADLSATDEHRISFWFVIGFCLMLYFLGFSSLPPSLSFLLLLIIIVK